MLKKAVATAILATLLASCLVNLAVNGWRREEAPYILLMAVMDAVGIGMVWMA